MKKAFTLIEIIVVLVIIGILMGVTMKFGSNRITDLKAQSLKDRFIDNYVAVQSQNLASSYHGKDRYTTLMLSLGEGIAASYDGSGTEQLFSDMQNMELKHIVGTTTLSLTPYHMGCSSDEGTGVSFDVEVNKNKTYCFVIDLATCSLAERACE